MAIQFLRGNASTLNSSQQVFLSGQPIFEQDTGKLKIGNGSDVYSALKYIGESGSTIPDYQFNIGSVRNGYIDLTDHVRLNFGEVEIPNSKTPSPISIWDTSLHRFGYYNAFSIQVNTSDIVGCKQYLLCGQAHISESTGEQAWVIIQHTWSYSRSPYGYLILQVMGDVDQIPNSFYVYYNVFSTDLTPTST